MDRHLPAATVHPNVSEKRSRRTHFTNDTTEPRTSQDGSKSWCLDISNDLWEWLTEWGTLQETFKRLAERYRTHFETEMQRDVSSFEESRIQDLLVVTTRDPSQSFRTLQRDFQQVWDQRLSHLLERRGQYLQVWSDTFVVCRTSPVAQRWCWYSSIALFQKLENIIKLLEGGLAQHLATVSEERQERSQGVEELSRLIRSPDTSTIIQLFERRAVLRTKVTERVKSRRAVSDNHDLIDSFVKTPSNQSCYRLYWINVTLRSPTSNPPQLNLSCTWKSRGEKH